MGIRFALRGTQTDAWFSYYGKDPGFFANVSDDPAVINTTVSGLFGNSAINLVPVSVTKGLVYPGYLNVGDLANNGSISVLARLLPTLTQPTCTGFGIFEAASARGMHGFGVRFAINSNGKAYAQLGDAFGNISTYTGTKVISTTADVPFDIMFAWDGTVGTGTLKVSINGVEWETLSPAGAVATTNRKVDVTNSIIIGSINSGPTSTKINLNELIVWDTFENHVYAARSNFWSITAFDGLSNTNPGAANVLSGTSYIISGVTYTGSYNAPISTDPGAANVLSGTVYVISGVTYTGSYHDGLYTDPGVGNVRSGTSYVFADSTLTGTLNVPTAVSGTAGTCDTNAIKETIRYVLDQSNTTTASPVDLSSNLARRVQTIMKVNPEKLIPQASLFPAVTVFLDAKDIEQKTIAGNQQYGKRRANLTYKIVGMVWNDRTQDYRVDPSDNDLEYLMENIELILRSYADLNRNCNWQFPTGVTYHSAGYDEQTHFRIGILDLQVSVFY